MERVIIGLGATIGGYVGWWLGERWGIMIAFTLSMVGTGVGIYYGRRAAREYLP